MRSTLLGYVLLVIFLAAEPLLRQGEEARSFHALSSDRGTTRLVGIAFGYGLNAGWLGALLSRLGWGRLLDSRVPAAGLALMGVGLALKVWSTRALGQFYTRTLRAAVDQPVVSSGPYRVVRHPGYLGALLLWIGFGLAVGNWVVLLSLALTTSIAYVRRVESEELMLIETVGERYAEYCRRTWRLLPGIY